MADKTNVQRLPAEELFRAEIDALIANETHPVPTGWQIGRAHV